MIVIASIHQPSTTTLELFDNVLLLSQGKPVYYGPPNHSTSYFSSLGYPHDPMMSSAEFMLELTNVDFSRSGDETQRLDMLVSAWRESKENKGLVGSSLGSETRNGNGNGNRGHEEGVGRRYPRGLFMQSVILTHRMALVWILYSLFSSILLHILLVSFIYSIFDVLLRLTPFPIIFYLIPSMSPHLTSFSSPPHLNTFPSSILQPLNPSFLSLYLSMISMISPTSTSKLTPEIIPRSSCLWRPYSNVLGSRNPYGNGLASTFIFAGKYSECS